MSQYKNLFLIVLVLLLVGGGLAIWNAERNTPPPVAEEELGEGPEVVGSNVSFVVTEGEAKKWKVEAAQAVYNETQTQAALKDIRGEFYNQAGEVVMAFTAPAGEFTNKNNQVVLTGGVVAKATDEKAGELQAPTMRWDAKSKQVVASGGIRMIFPQGVSTANQCRFNLDFTHVFLEGNVATEVRH